MPSWIDVNSVRESITKLVTADVGLGVRTYCVLGKREKQMKLNTFQKRIHTVHSWSNTWQFLINTKMIKEEINKKKVAFQSWSADILRMKLYM